MVDLLKKFGVDSADGLYNLLIGWIDKQLFTQDNMYQVIFVIIALLIAKVVSRPICRRLAIVKHRKAGDHWYAMPLEGLIAIMHPLFTNLLLIATSVILIQLEQKHDIIDIAINLTAVWIVIRFSASFVSNPILGRWIAVTAWIIASLNILGLLDPLAKEMDDLAISIGDSRLSLLMVIKGILSFIAVMWIANVIARVTERRIHKMTSLTPSLRVLFVKMTRILLIVLAFVIALNTIGIDMTSLAVFSGAVGVGIGFGLQKVVSNFISGIILLLDQSIKPGDVIAINDTYGWVNRLGARCVSVITRDGKEHLIPNEQLIAERVENWSYSDKNIRLKIPVGISYKSDVRLALELMKEAARKNSRLLKYPAPNALLRQFGDSSIDLELRVWIDDPANGISNVSSEIMLNIWDLFHENNIHFPFPQRDIYIKEGSEISIVRGDKEREEDDSDKVS